MKANLTFHTVQYALLVVIVVPTHSAHTVMSPGKLMPVLRPSLVC
jgi:hypothetical protein